ncbi:ABC transporter substrate-binding protein [Chromobacterium sp. Beijing]|uniref:substrate-binding periplasmic protein n=1 Tax=Chromobacterium sp. Beijing TaxID=2735795 RepID=UPI001F22C7CB|nr:transporter substrate-binding domain-containing protein [Chromobacterium sp. Beijing]UJB32279.1 transporter substrate-binding domain-containing protein [Chromobacterium sp. Beijing]
MRRLFRLAVHGLICAAALYAGPGQASSPPVVGACNRELSVGWDTRPPYHYQSAHQQLDGYSIAVLNEAARRAGCPLNYQQMPWARNLLNLKNGQVDMAMNALKTPEREQFAHFVWAYNPTTVRIWSLSSNAARWPIHRLADLDKYGKLVLGVTRGDSYGTIIDAWLKLPPPSVSVDSGPTQDINIQKLRARRLDLLLANSITMRTALQAQPAEAEIVPLAPVWNIGGAYFIFSKSSVPQPVVDAFQQALTGMRRDGSIQTLYQRYFEAPYPEE